MHCLNMAVQMTFCSKFCHTLCAVKKSYFFVHNFDMFDKLTRECKSCITNLTLMGSEVFVTCLDMCSKATLITK
jgi:hypothetical protein